MAPQGASCLFFASDRNMTPILSFYSSLRNEKIGEVQLFTSTNADGHFLPRIQGIYIQTLTDAGPTLPNGKNVPTLENIRLPDLDALWECHASGVRYLLEEGGVVAEEYRYNLFEPDENFDPEKAESERARIRRLLEIFPSDSNAAAELLRCTAAGQTRGIQRDVEFLRTFPFRYFQTPLWNERIQFLVNRPLEQLYREGKIKLPNQL